MRCIMVVCRTGTRTRLMQTSGGAGAPAIWSTYRAMSTGRQSGEDKTQEALREVARREEQMRKREEVQNRANFSAPPIVMAGAAVAGPVGAAVAATGLAMGRLLKWW
mmetsp:Transcript_91819/g.210365  ORF Transcript_91819/g.210365 Transcript_91819/m.210365 type:complete len:107 (-) Transcript_91819:256-576(-)